MDYGFSLLFHSLFFYTKKNKFATFHISTSKVNSIVDIFVMYYFSDNRQTLHCNFYYDEQ
jgi:hypothetical protein